jgi:hypothetical protein
VAVRIIDLFRSGGALQPPFAHLSVRATADATWNGGAKAGTVTENWGIIEVDGIPAVPGVIVGGYGRFSGAAGDMRESSIIGTNATGCPNSTASFHIRPGSTRGGGWRN